MIPTKLLRGLEPARTLFSTCSSRYLAVKLELEECHSPVARTVVQNPINQNKSHQGMWYTIEQSDIDRLFKRGLTNRYRRLNEIWKETSLMIREPSTTVIDYIKRSDLTKFPNKFMLYGDEGVGKTLCLAHILHFLAMDGWIIVHTHLPKLWLNQFSEIKQSLTKPEFYDHTIDGSVWLQNFKLQNEALLQRLELVTNEKFVWTQRESTEVGSTLLSFIDNGISRARYASECIHFLLNHLKKYATEGRCKVAFVSDGINAFFSPMSAFRRDDRTFVESERFTLMNAFKQLLEPNWRNGCIVGIVDKKSSPSERRKSNLPRYLLRQEGWEYLDPFVPILVEPYNKMEFSSQMDYYIDRNWLNAPNARSLTARKELEFSSNRNPRELMLLVNSK